MPPLPTARTRLEAEPNTRRKHREEGCVAQVVVVARGELGQALLKTRVVIDRLTADRRRLRRIAGAAGKRDLQRRLALVVEAQFDREAQVLVRARNDVAPAHRQTRRGLAEAYRSAAME